MRIEKASSAGLRWIWLVAAAWTGAAPPLAAAARAQAEGASRPISPQALEERYGLQVTLVAVTAAGGMVDFRFRVVDPEKARNVIGGSAGLPALIAVKSGARLTAPHQAARTVSLRKGGVSFILYPNVRRAIQPGTRVAVAFGGGVRVEAVAVK